jgi:hypothetical protein
LLIGVEIAADADIDRGDTVHVAQLIDALEGADLVGVVAEGAIGGRSAAAVRPGEAREDLGGDDAGARRDAGETQGLEAGGDAGNVGAVIAAGDRGAAIDGRTGAGLARLPVRAQRARCEKREARQQRRRRVAHLLDHPPAEEGVGAVDAGVENRDRLSASVDAARPELRRADQRCRLPKSGWVYPILVEAEHVQIAEQSSQRPGIDFDHRRRHADDRLEDGEAGAVKPLAQVFERSRDPVSLKDDLSLDEQMLEDHRRPEVDDDAHRSLGGCLRGEKVALRGGGLGLRG